MTTIDDDDASLDAALQRQLRDALEPADAGFSLRVMAALPPRVRARQRDEARWVRRVHWTAGSIAACGAASLLYSSPATLDGPHALAALALLGLLLFWTVPSRWTLG